MRYTLLELINIAKCYKHKEKNSCKDCKKGKTKITYTNLGLEICYCINCYTIQNEWARNEYKYNIILERCEEREKKM